MARGSRLSGVRCWLHQSLTLMLKFVNFLPMLTAVGLPWLAAVAGLDLRPVLNVLPLTGYITILERRYLRQQCKDGHVK